MARPARAALTALGTVLGIAALVATVGLASTAGAQIVNRLDQLAATDVVVEPRPGEANVLRWDAASELERLNGVRSAAFVSDLGTGEDGRRTVSTVRTSRTDVPVISVSPSAWSTVTAHLAKGRLLGAADEELSMPTAVLGAAAARRLGIEDVVSAPTVFVDGVPLTVVGIVDAVVRRPELLSSVIVSDGVARQRFGLTAPGRVQIETTLGANELIRDQAARLLSPQRPDRLLASSPPLPKAVRANVSSDVAALLLTLGGVSLVVGALGIANVTLVSVLERTGEIGVRRALGALRRHIGAQFLCESTVLGLLGGAAGTAVGIVVVTAVALAKSWNPVLPTGAIVASPVVGAIVGLLAGLYPAWRASGIEPSEALRGST